MRYAVGGAIQEPMLLFVQLISDEVAACHLCIGNGILARSLVNSLLEHGCNVSVWCCRPSSLVASEEGAIIQNVFPQFQGRLKVFSTAVSDLKWRCLDDNSSWEEFVYSDESHASNEQDLQSFLRNLTDHSTSALPIAIDWHGAYAFESIPLSRRRFLPLLYMNFRVYSAGIQDKTRHEWLNNMERQALKHAEKVIALSEHDGTLLKHIGGFSEDDPTIDVFYPPLRKEVHALATAMPTPFGLPLPISLPRDTRFVTCVVRLSREKETLLFLAFLKSCRTILNSKHWVPVLVGSPSDQTYSQQVRTGLKECCPFAIDLVDTFLSPVELCSLFSRTALNFHPCSYDAYGMTIIEAAAMGVPSVIANNGKVGASSVMQDASIYIEMPPLSSGTKPDDVEVMLPEQSIERLLDVLSDELQLQQLGKLARKRALEWNESAYGKALLEVGTSMGDYNSC
eukprot:scaffold4805_cov136-Cylindrotheca_fusiformis.AAC.12